MKTILPGVLFALALFSQDSPPPRNAPATAGSNKSVFPNGRFWKPSSEERKTGFILGYEAGVEEMFFALGATALPFERFKELRDTYFPVALTASEVASALDRFYETPENGPIPVVLAIKVVAARANGTEETKIQKMIEDLRARNR